jgi:hypothetical protein
MKRYVALILVLLVPALFAARPPEYSTDIVVLADGQVIQTMKLYVSGAKSRVEGMTAGALGKITTITRRDKGVQWMLYVDRWQYTEQPIPPSGQHGKPDLASLDLGSLKKDYLGKEKVLGYSCTKMRISLGDMPNGQQLLSTVWVADGLDLPLRLEAMGMVQENRNLRTGPQPAGLFEIPAGYTRTSSPGAPPTRVRRPSWPPVGRGTGATSDSTATHQVPAETDRPSATEPNTNRMGGDYRDFELPRADPAACRAACDREPECRAWTYVAPGQQGDKARCWLKDSVMPANPDTCCTSGVKGATATSTGSMGGDQFELEADTDRPGDDFRDFAPAKADPNLCAQACTRFSRCKSWTWVKPEPDSPTGHCWLKQSVPEPVPESRCVSGLKQPRRYN